MLKLIQSFFSLLFFCFIFGVLWVKNLPSHYTFTIEKEVSYPLISYAEHLNQNQTVADTNTHFQSSVLHWIKSSEVQLLRRENDFLIYDLPTQLYFSLQETWRFDTQKNILKSQYSFSPSFVSKALLVFNPDFIDAVKENLYHKLQWIEQSVHNEFVSHRLDYLGENDFPTTYYLAVEGESSWQNAEVSYQTGQEQLLKFAQNQKIKTTGKPFVLFPKMTASSIQWRAALAVDRYYSFEDAAIRCRRFRGGKVLQLIHKGPLTMISESWKILFDSLQNNQQAYPVFQQSLISANDSSNPLNWETLLSLPISE